MKSDPSLYPAPQRRGGPAFPGQPYAPSRQAQDWTRGLAVRTGSRRGVIARKTAAQPAFSAEGVRWDVWMVVLTLTVVLFACVLFADVEALKAGGDRIVNLNAGIASLEDSNGFLRQQVNQRMNHPVLTRMNEQAEAGEEKVITLSAAPLS